MENRDLGSLYFCSITLDHTKFVNLANFSGFLCKVGTRQTRKIRTFFCFLSCCLLLLRVPPHATRLQHVSFRF